MQTIRPAPARHGAAGEFIDNDDFTVTDDVFHVAVKQGVRPQAGVQMVEDAQMGGVIQAVALLEQSRFQQHILNLLMPVLG